MRKIIYLFLVYFAFIISVQADFNNYTEVTLSWATFDKIPTEDKILHVYEDYDMNPFEGHTITKNIVNCTWNNCPCWTSGCSYTTGYSVDNVIFNSSHPLFLSANSIYKDEPENNWIDTKIQLLEDSYTLSWSYYVPDQIVIARKYYDVKFSFDVTPPTCWDVKVYDDEELTQSYTLTQWWINSPKYYTMECEDLQTWCKCTPEMNSCVKEADWTVRTPAETLWHKSTPTAYFINNVDLWNVCEWNLPNWVEQILYDSKSPSIKIFLGENHDFKADIDSNREYELDEAWNKYDWEEIPWKVYFTTKDILKYKSNNWETNILNFNIVDEYLDDSAHGVSWIKSFDFKVFRNWLELSDCWRSETYDEYNPDGSIEESDEKFASTDWYCNQEFLKSWEYEIVVQAFDWAWNHTKITSNYIIYPTDEWLWGTLDLIWNNVWSKYANNIDFYNYETKVYDKYDNIVYNKFFSSVSYVKQWCEVSEECKQIDRIVNDASFSDALKIDSVNIDWVNNELLKIKLKSYAPWIYKESFRIKMPKWNDSYSNIYWDNYVYVKTSDIANPSSENFFKKPYIWISLQIKDNSGWWDWKPIVWSEQEYKYTIQKSDSNISISWDYTIWNINHDTLTTKWNNNYAIDYISTLSNTHTSPTFSSRLIASETASDVTSAPVVRLEIPIISYNLWWKTVRYYLSPSEIDADNSEWVDINWIENTFIWVKIIWTQQWQWFWVITGQEENFSDLSKLDARNDIRSKTYSYIKNMNNLDSLWWVLYIEWDMSFSALRINWKLTWVETIVIKDWNFLIDENINSTIWIIVLKDNYDVSKDYNNAWNIYIIPSVTKVDAIMYADGWLISTNSDGDVYETDSDERTYALEKQLIIKWSLFTRNTIGGAILENNLLLPGGQSSDFNKAMIYDLNYLRRWNVWCEDKNIDLDCNDENLWEYKDATIIIYNPEVQTNPPKLFK